MLLSKLCNPKQFCTLSSSSSSSHGNKPKNLSLISLLKSGFTPTLNDFNQFLRFLSRNHRFETIIHFYSQMKSNKITVNSCTQSIFANALLKQRKHDEAAQFMKTQIANSPVSRCNRIWDSLIQGLCINEEDPEKGLSVLRDCLRIDGILPSSFTFCSLIHTFSSQGKMDRAIEVLEMMTDEKINYPFDNFVCSKVISGFIKIGKPELAVGFCDNAIESAALRPNVVTYTALLSAYCRLGRIEEVHELVSRIENNGLACDVVFYSCWIYEYFREGILGEACRKHREMVEKKIELDTISYTILVDGFSKEGYVEKAIGFLKSMKKDGLKPNLVTYTAIMLGFCKIGKLEEAFVVLKMVEDLGIEVDEFTYATLIDGVCRTGDFDRVFHLLDEMEKKGIRPSVVTYNTLINGLCKAGRTSEAEEVSKGIIGDAITYSTLLQGYIEEENSVGILETKRRLELAGVCMDVVMCNILIKALFMVGSFEDALAIYKGMPEMNLAADSFTYCTLIDGYCKSGRIEEALEIFDDFRGTSISSVECYNCILCGLCKNGMVNLAIEVFIELNERGLPLDVGLNMMLLKAIFEEKGAVGIVDFLCRIEILGCNEIFDIICNNAICYLCKKGCTEAAFDAYMVMIKNGLVLNSQSYYSILAVLIDDGKRWPVQPILNTFVKNYGVIEPKVSKILSHYLCMKNVNDALRFLKMMENVTLPITVVERLIKSGRVLDAYKLLTGADNNLPHMDVVDYSIVVDGLCKGGHIDKALDICAFARKKGIKLSVVTYNSVLNGLCRQGCFVGAFRLFDSFEKIDVVPTEITYSTLIDTLSKEGHLLDAKKLFERMLQNGLKPNTHIYNSLINGYCKWGQLDEGLKLLVDLEVENLKPDEFTVSSVINGCCRNGNMESALGYFYDFKEKGVLPDFLGFMYLIRGLYSKGRMQESQTILKEMLQSESVVNLLKRVEIRVETEPTENSLAYSKGCMQESQAILKEMLQSEPVVNLLKRDEIGVETELTANSLAYLCEQGHIRYVIKALEKVGSMFFPVRKPSARNGPEKVKETGSEFKLCNEEKMEKEVKSSDDVDERLELNDFDSYYNLIASLCSKGELLKANKLAKVLPSFDRGCY